MHWRWRRDAKLAVLSCSFRAILRIGKSYVGDRRMTRILIADDDAAIRDIIRFALERVGFATVEAATGRATLACFAETKPDLIVLDIMMPELDGIDVCREIRRGSATPILFLSSRDEEVDRVLGLELGADDYLAKPFSPRELVARVKAALCRGRRHPHCPKARCAMASFGLSLTSGLLMADWFRRQPKGTCARLRGRA